MAAIGPIAGAAGSIIGGLGGLLGGGPSVYELRDSPNVVTNPTSDPLLAALSFNAQQRLGFSDPSMLMQASPLQQMMNKVSEHPGYHGEHKDWARQALTNLSQGKAFDAGLQPKFATKARELLNGIGLNETVLRNIAAEELGYQQKARSYAERAGQVDVYGDRLAAQSRMGELAKSFPGGNFEAYQGVTQEALLRRIEEDTRKARESALASANAGGYNPGGIIGDIERQRLQQRSDSELNSIAQALALSSGRQSLATTELDALGAFLSGGETTAQNAAGLRSGMQMSAAQIASDQATAAMNARLQSQAQAQASSQKQANMNTVFEGLGQGVSNYGLLNMLNSGGKKTSFSSPASSSGYSSSPVGSGYGGFNTNLNLKW
jgi:hypothetical protein